MLHNIFFQVGPTDQLGNGNSLDSQTNEFSSSKQGNRTFLCGKVNDLTRGFASDRSIVASLKQHLRVYNYYKKTNYYFI